MGAFLGVLLHAIGGFAAGTFYIPIKMVKKWSWETAWFVLGITAWLIVPFLFAWLTTPNLLDVLQSADANAIMWTYIFGVLWGIGALTFGLTMRYLGVALGMTIALGLTTAFGTLVPPIYKGEMGELLSKPSGQLVFFGIILALIGVAVAGKAGILKEKDLGTETGEVEEFNLWKGLGVATIAGILSASFAFGLEAGQPISKAAIAHGVTPIFQNNATLVWILWGGITTNFIYTVYLSITNKTYSDFTNRDTPLTKNYFWAALGGLTWYLQFFFYGMGTTKLGKEYDFASWAIHMSFIILFSNLWGLYFKEWKGSSQKTYKILYWGLAIIVSAILIIGLPNQILGLFS